MTEAADGLTHEERIALSTYQNNPNGNDDLVNIGRDIYALLQSLENAFPKKGEVVFGKVAKTATPRKSIYAGRKVQGESYKTLVTVGHNAGNLLKAYRKYSEHYGHLKIARTTLGYAILHPMDMR